MIIILNEVLTGRKPADDCHSPRTAALKNVLHTAGSLALQICGGVRPYLYEGERLQHDIPILSNLAITDHEQDLIKINQMTFENVSINENSLPATTNNSLTQEEEASSTAKVNNVVKPTMAHHIPSDIIQRIQHLIRAGWSNKPGDRPVAKGVANTLRNILKFLRESSSDCEADVQELSNKFISKLEV